METKARVPQEPLRGPVGQEGPPAPAPEAGGRGGHEDARRLVSLRRGAGFLQKQKAVCSVHGRLYAGTQEPLPLEEASPEIDGSKGGAAAACSGPEVYQGVHAAGPGCSGVGSHPAGPGAAAILGHDAATVFAGGFAGGGRATGAGGAGGAVHAA